LPFRDKILCSIVVIILGLPASLFAWDSNAQSLGSLQSFTGILQMPNARVLPDWKVRLKIGSADPWRYYGGAVGILDRFEFHGQFTRVDTVTAFSGYDYGAWKDRSAGMRAVLIKENEFLPQISAGFYDATGNGFFASRYVNASKMFGNVDVTLGLGQGMLAGEYPPANESLLLSDPFRETKVFGGVEWHVNPELTLSAEYTTINWSNMFGYRDNKGKLVKKDDSQFNLNFGVKYKLTDNIHISTAYLQGDTIAGSLDIQLPLEPESSFAWKKSRPYIPGEKIKWDAYEADNEKLSVLISGEIKALGFKGVSAACSADSVWIEFENTVHLSDARSLGQIASLCDKVLPGRITQFYLNIKDDNTVIQSFKTTRGVYRAFADSKLDKEGYLAFSELNLYKDENLEDFKQDKTASDLFTQDDDRFSFKIEPKVRTFVDNKTGFFKHKGLLRAQAGYTPWNKGQFLGELEYTVFNEYDELDFDPLEKNNAVRTDLLDYEDGSTLRMSMFALEQKVSLPKSIQGRFAIGYFESAYAGVGAEVFRYFDNGLWGIGFDTQIVRKRDPDNNFLLRDDPDKVYSTAFFNLYSQILPSQGIEAGLKMGQFLAGDWGIRIDIRRSFKYFTIGAWYTKTDTSLFESPENRGSDQKGVYIRFPLSIFSPKDIPGHLNYTFSSFLKDSGSLVRQPGSLYPMDPWSTPDHTRRTLNDMRKY